MRTDEVAFETDYAVRKVVIRSVEIVLLPYGVYVVPFQVDVSREADARDIAPVEERVGCRRGREEEEGGDEDEGCGEVGAQSGFGEDYAEGFEDDALWVDVSWVFASLVDRKEGMVVL